MKKMTLMFLLIALMLAVVLSSGMAISTSKAVEKTAQVEEKNHRCSEDGDCPTGQRCVNGACQ